MKLSKWLAPFKKSTTARSPAEEKLARAMSDLEDTESEIIELYEAMSQDVEEPSNVHHLPYHAQAKAQQKR